RPLGIFEPHPAEALGWAEKHILERPRLGFEIPVAHQRRAAAFLAGAQRCLMLGHMISWFSAFDWAQSRSAGGTRQATNDRGVGDKSSPRSLVDCRGGSKAHHLCLKPVGK